MIAKRLKQRQSQHLGSLKLMMNPTTPITALRRAIQTKPPSSTKRILNLNQTSRTRCLYHTDSSPPTLPYNPTETAILTASLPHIRSHGFTTRTLSLGCRDAGYLPISTNLFPRGAFDLVAFWLARSRLGLKSRLEAKQLPQKWEAEKFGLTKRVRGVVLERLAMNVEAGVVGRWTEALAVMAQPSYVPASLGELHKLSDEVWYLAGDVSVDGSWYTKRASLSTIYAATEVYQTQLVGAGVAGMDRLEGTAMEEGGEEFERIQAETGRFLDDRLRGVGRLGGSIGAVGEWMGFSARSAVNVLRSRGMNI